MNILVSCASDLFSDYLPFSESLISYEIVRRLAERGHHLHVFSPRIDVKNPIPNVKFYEIGRYALFKEGDQELKEEINWWKYSLRSYVKGRALLKQVDLIHHILPSYPFHFSFFVSLPKPFIFGPMPLVSKGGEGGEEISVVGISEKKSTFSRISRGIFSRGQSLFRGFEREVSFYFWAKTLQKSDKLLLQLEKVKGEISTEFHTKSIVTYLGVDTACFQPSLKSSFGPTILFVGNLLEAKGLKYLLGAMPSVISRFPCAQLVLVGRGSERTKFQELVETLQIKHNVCFEGFVEHTRIASYFQQCDIFCLPTLLEAFGIVLLEAMSCGKPIVATNVGGVPEIVEHGKSGLLVTPKDSKALAEAIMTLLQNVSLRERIGRYNRKLCERKYDWSKVVDLIEQAYKSLIHN